MSVAEPVPSPNDGVVLSLRPSGEDWDALCVGADVNGACACAAMHKVNSALAIVAIFQKGRSPFLGRLTDAYWL